MKKYALISMLLFTVLFTSCTKVEREVNIESNEIKKDYQANFLWLEGMLTYCTMMEEINNPNDVFNECWTKFFPDSTRVELNGVLQKISKFSHEYPLKRLDYGYLDENSKWEIRGVIAVFAYDSTTELIYVFCFDTSHYFKIPSRNPNEYENIDVATKKMLEKELDKKRKYTLYKYLVKIEGSFIPLEDLIHIEKEK